MGLARLFSFCSYVVNRNEWGVIASSRYGCTIGAKKKGVKFFFKFFFRWVWVLGCGCSGVGAWVWARGCGCSGVGARVWVLGSVGGGGGMEMGGRGMGRAGLGLSLSDGRESPPWADPTRIRIAGSGVMDRPTFRLPGSQMRARNFIPTRPALALSSARDDENASRSS